MLDYLNQVTLKGVNINKCKNCGANSFLNDTCQYCGSVDLKEKKINASLQKIKSNNGVYFELKDTILTGNNNTVMFGDNVQINGNNNLLSVAP